MAGEGTRMPRSREGKGQTMECTCENVEHFDDGPGHIYGATFPRVADYRTEGAGTFAYCAACVAHNHVPQESAYLGVRGGAY